MSEKRKPKVVHMVTTPESISLMRGQLSYLGKSGFDVTVISSSGDRLYEEKSRENINVKAIDMERTISPFKDFISLVKIIIFFLKEKPDICNAGTPKAGLLGMMAAWFTRVPVKIYTCRGLPFEGAFGVKKKILKFTERIASFCADRVICISPSIEKKLIKLKLVNSNKTVVFGSGSSNGLQLSKFRLTEEIRVEMNKIKNFYKLDKYDFIVGYVGRINNFKGAEETIIVFDELQREYDNIALLLVGEKEIKDSISKKVHKIIESNENIIEVGRVENPVPYYYLMDVLSFPTHREGFGNVSIEAQATGTPVITTNATGSVDTVIHNKTGYINEVGDNQALKKSIISLMKNPKKAKLMGENGQIMVNENFDSQIIWDELKGLYMEGLR